LVKKEMRKLLWVGAAAFGAYEAYALYTKEDGDTISELIWDACKRPLVPFTIGMLVGHFVWQSQDIYSAKITAEVKKEN
jgi:hypothetical protein